MNDMYDTNSHRLSLPFRKGDQVRIVQGVDKGRTGEIVDINPISARPYVVKLREGWFIHFAEDRLSPAR